MKQIIATPFLKWAGGKSQLLNQIDAFLPIELKNGEITEYFEPFLGGGAMFFYIAQKYPGIKKAYLYDINEELILAYKVIQKKVNELIDELEALQELYYSKTEKEREKLFYEIRESFNAEKSKTNFKVLSLSWIKRAAQLIFLNKTCFNGLFRVNNNGRFNVPFGRYKKPGIYQKENLIELSKVLQIAKLETNDFENIKKKVTTSSFIYYDPPYKPISTTSNFVGYSKNSFNDDEQKRLSELFRELANQGVKQLLSNSDPKSLNENDTFFDDLYKGFDIEKVFANRMINCNGSKRGKISEILITSYKNDKT
jgi:DNA adenine methylase